MLRQKTEYIVKERGVEIKATDVKVLKDRMGAGLMDCKKALIEAGGDITEAEKLLKKKGMAKAARKSTREATEGAVCLYVSEDEKTAGLVEVKCETDFVARSDVFQQFIRDFAYGVMEASLVNVTGVQLDVVSVSGKPVQDARHAAILKLGENIQLSRATTISTEGVLYGYRHGNKIAVVVALEKADQQLGKDIAMHIAALSPAAVTVADIPAAVMQEERMIYEAQLQDDKKSDEIKQRIIEGKLKKFASGICLYGQPFVKSPKETIEAVLHKQENSVINFIRYELGEASSGS